MNAQRKASHLRLVRRDDPLPFNPPWRADVPHAAWQIPKRQWTRRNGPVALRSQYEGTCRACSLAYAVGDPILWKRGIGVTHDTDECADFWARGGCW